MPANSKRDRDTTVGATEGTVLGCRTITAHVHTEADADVCECDSKNRPRCRIAPAVFEFARNGG